MRVAIRADSSIRIGTGHVMRCLALASALRDRGADLRFLCRELPGAMMEALKQQGFAVECLGAGTDSFAVPPTDAEDTARSLERAGWPPDWLIVDHYGVGAAWELRLRPSVGRILVIDDLADRAHDCDVLVDQNFNLETEKRYRRLVPDCCRLLVGPQFALLRPEFYEMRKRLRERDGSVRRVLVFFGGVDATNQTQKVLTAIAVLHRSNFEVDVVVGGTNPWRELVRDICDSHSNFRFHCQTAKMAELIFAADLAIGAGGIATWERCCLGLPSVVVAVAGNQERNAAAMGRQGYLLYLGTTEQVTSAVLAACLNRLLAEPELLRSYSLRSLELVDGRGAEQVAAVLAG